MKNKTFLSIFLFFLFSVASAWAATVDLTTVTGNKTLRNGDLVKGVLGANVKISIADGATVTLNGVTINGVDNIDYNWPGITCEGNCNIILAENSRNIVTGFYSSYPGIEVPYNKTLTISGSGYLEANSNGYAAGIGGASHGNVGNIVINGGTIIATGGHSAAGIGCGVSYGAVGNHGSITINGGDVTAIGGNGAAGIGSGYHGEIYDITISGGIVKATGGENAAGIGTGEKGEVIDIMISGGIVKATGGNGAVGIGYGKNGSVVWAIDISGNTKVTAIKGKNSSYSIGKRDGGSIDGVTIGGIETQGIATSPFVWISLTHPDITVADIADQTYTGSAICPAVSITDEMTPLEAGVDYSVECTDNISAGTAKMTITGMGNYAGAISKTFKINPKEIAIAWGAQTSFVYDGTNHVPTATADGIVSGDECTITVLGAAKDAGKHTATAASLNNDNYLLPTENLEKPFEITQREITIAWGEQTSFVYDGADHVPTATVDGTVNSDDCTITVSGAAKDAGKHTATAMVVCNDNYQLPTENLEKPFEITPKEITITWGELTLFYNGTEQAPTATVDGTINSDDCTITISGVAKNVGKHTATATVVCNDNYQLPTENLEVQFEITYTNLAMLKGNYTVQNGEIMTGELAGNYKISIADGATVTLDGVAINGGNNGKYQWAGITCEGDCNIVLADSSVNNVTGFHDSYPGIYVPEHKTLTISGKGSLDAQSCGYGDGTGIGGGGSISAGNIVIRGGTITATSRGYGAGIGSGYNASVGNIEISGGTIIATQDGANGAGVGSGYYGSVGNIKISGGTITATGSRDAAAIGGGYKGTVGNITISGIETTVTAIKSKYATYSIGKGNAGSRTGTINIGGFETSDIEASPFEYPYVTNLASLNGDYIVHNGETLTGELAGNYKILIADGATVTLNGVTINGVNSHSYKWAGITCEGNCNIILAENSTNSVKGFYDEYPGIYVPENYTLTISGTGSLDASSNGWGAGIGCGRSESAGNIVINGGTITATGGNSAAGIGGDNDKTVGNIIISGGSVTATGGSGAAGIGGGYKGIAGDIVISGGTIVATGTTPNGAGVGGGGYGTIGDIVISGGTIVATGAANGAGVGCGLLGKVGNITISGGIISATGGEDAAGIGGGDRGTVGSVVIGGDKTKISATKGKDAFQSIGQNDGYRTGTITIGGVEFSDIVTSPFEYPYVMLVYKKDYELYAVFNGEYNGDASVKISEAIGVSSITLNRTFSANTPSTVVLPFELPRYATFNAEFYGLNDVAQVGNAWKATMKYIGDGVLPKANTPYVVLLPNDGQLEFNLDGFTAEMHTNDIDTTWNKDSTWYFTGVYQYKTWGGEDDDELGLAYAFSGRNEDKVAKGKFGKIVAGGYAYPLRAYLRKKNADVVLKQSQGRPLAPGEQRAASAASLYSVEFLPETIEVELVKDDENGNEHTTFVGRMNTRTGEIQIIRDGRTFDLKGRHVGKPKAKGIYLKK
ncbi:hypothetical protein SAMN05720487_13412 [Fibrobacter sp. UWT2]|uniref:beta strand repeat-containing protein n=1 Tax=Fibrobacter sp. UWT2 TaxID=1896224 RepID=UPI00091C9697|nr:hypothetical protein [Fibrobacter sp. UWT2]SHL85827.1 hypothetical protein SAMN05720487_13412 [Fibrobacter sp. UWT2]